MAKISINGSSFDPIEDPTSVPQLPNNFESKYILIQTNPSLTDEWRAELDGLGVTILEYLPKYSYLCRYEKADLQPIRSLSYIAWAEHYSPGLKLRKDVSETTDPELKEVDVVFHDNLDPQKEGRLAGEVAKAANLNLAELNLGRHKVRITLKPECLSAVRAIDDVRHIEPVRQPELLNNVAREILGVGAVNGNGGILFEGEGQIVVVADSGFDIGREDNVHAAFRGGENGTTRVIKLYKVGRPGDEAHGIPGSANDPIGHGTHVAGSALGDGESTQFGKVRGTAPKARLIVQSLLDANNKLKPPVDLHQLFLPPYEQFNARIHNDSWGSLPGEGVYDQQSFEVDDFIWNHRDFVVCFAAGNEGRDSTGHGEVDLGSITAPGTAKNCITVGATESDRSDFGRTYGQEFPARFQTGPLATDRMADNKDSIAAISSRGPTRDERFKPDLVAPGTFILSAQSRALDPTVSILATGDSNFCFRAGTSMASPLVAGCAALVREFLESRELKNPSAALVKALLINGARPLSGPTGPLRPEEQGFGRVDMSATIEPFPNGVRVDFKDERTALAEGKDETIQLNIQPLTTSLKVTLVWTDPPGASLQNDLDLIVKTSDEERHGNQPPASTKYDRANNVEQVVWNNVPANKVDIIVKAARIKQPSQPQPYALVIRTATSSPSNS